MCNFVLDSCHFVLDYQPQEFQSWNRHVDNKKSPKAQHFHHLLLTPATEFEVLKIINYLFLKIVARVMCLYKEPIQKLTILLLFELTTTLSIAQAQGTDSEDSQDSSDSGATAQNTREILARRPSYRY